MLHNMVHQIVEYFNQHPHAGGIFTFIIAFLEALPILGTIIPGSVAMTAMGALVGSGVIPVSSTLIAATMGAFVGDCCGFAVGIYFQDNYRSIWPFKNYQHWLDRSEEFFSRHGGKSVIIGRFIGPARSTVPMVAGLLKLTWPRFVGAALPSAMLWVIVYMLPGILLGAFSLEIPIKESPQFILLGLTIIASLWFVYWICQRSFLILTLYARATINHTWLWLCKHHTTHWMTRCIRKKNAPEDCSQLMLLFTSLLCLILFLIIFIGLIMHSNIAAANKPIYYLLQSLRTQPGDHLFIIITAWGNTANIIMMALALLAALCYSKHWRLSSFFILNLAMTAVITLFIKTFYFSLRPEVVLPYIHENSFPSGHAMITTAVFGFAAYAYSQLMTPKRRHIFSTIAATAIILIAISRLYLGAHWFTDVIAGLSLGLGILLFNVMLYRRREQTSPTRPTTIQFWLISAILTFVIIPCGYIIKDYPQLKTIYQTSTIQISLDETQWWQQPLAELPIARLNRFGKPVQPFNIQWVASLDTIQLYLKQQHWHILGKTTAESTNTKLPVSLRPRYFFPLLHNNAAPVLSAVKTLPNEDGIVELNLWLSRVSFKDNATPLWLGNISYDRKTTKKLAIKKFSPKQPIDFSDKALLTVMSQYQTKIIQVPDTLMPKSLQRTGWGGNIIILKNNQNLDKKQQGKAHE